jgi:hypothetical protein
MLVVGTLVLGNSLDTSLLNTIFAGKPLHLAEETSAIVQGFAMDSVV